MQRRTVLGLGLGLGLGLTGALAPAHAIGPRPPRLSVDAALDAELDAIADDPACPLASLSVLTIRNGVIAYEHQHGYRRVTDGVTAGLPAGRDTLYRIASVSKLVTTLGLMRLVEQGKARLDADVGTYLGFPLRNPHYPEQALTLRMLLTHTSSLRDEAGYSWPLGTALKDIFASAPPAMWSATNAPGTFFTYCNLGWGVIGTIMERIGNERFDRLMQRLVLGPLGITGGYNVAELPPAALENLAAIYRKRTVDTEVWDLHGPWIAQVDDYRNGVPAAPAGIASYVPGTNATPFSPTGGLRISAHDLGTIMLMLMHQGSHNGRRILQPATLKTMFARAWTYDGKGANGDSLGGVFEAWGLGNEQFLDTPGSGTRLVDGGGFPSVGHLGDAYGLRAVFAADLARRDGMIVLVGGSGADPETQHGRYSSMARFEENILSAMHRHLLRRDA